MINPKLAPLGKIIRDNLRDVPDFPQTGVLFRDISPLLANGEAFSQLVKGLADFYRGRVDLVAGLESRGFLIAAPVAVELGLGTLMIRKAGKLPGPVIGIDYGLEYGKSRMELQPDWWHHKCFGGIDQTCGWNRRIGVRFDGAGRTRWSRAYRRPRMRSAHSDLAYLPLFPFSSAYLTGKLGK